MLFWLTFINIVVVLQNWNNIGPNDYVSTVALLSIIQRDEEQHFLFNKPFLMIGVAVK